MSIFRIHKNTNYNYEAGYVVMRNTHLQDRSLSLKAKGLLSVMLSYPDGVECSTLGLLPLNRNGKETITTILKELSDKGYVTATKTRSSDGRFLINYDVYETPKSNKL